MESLILQIPYKPRNMTTGNTSWFWKYICLLFFTTQHVSFVACGTTEISFTCSSGLITSITKGSTDPAMIVIKDGSTYCHYDQTDCKSKSKKPQLHVIIQSDKNKNILAGHEHSKNLHYSLECKDEYDVVGTASPFFISDTTPITSVVTKSAKQKPKLDMIIKKDDTVLKENVYIGEKLTLEMSATGYKVFPKECTAFNSDDSSEQDKVVIWQYKSPSSGDKTDKCSKYDPAITEENWTLMQPANLSMSIPIYAFRFTESPNVFIRCSAHLCPTSKLDCSVTCETSKTQRRRRRSSPISKREEPERKTEEASVSFSAVSENQIPNKANVLSVQFTVVITTIIFGGQLVRFP